MMINNYLIADNYLNCKNQNCPHITPHKYEPKMCDIGKCICSENNYCKCISIKKIRKDKLKHLQLI